MGEGTSEPVRFHELECTQLLLNKFFIIFFIDIEL